MIFHLGTFMPSARESVSHQVGGTFIAFVGAYPDYRLDLKHRRRMLTQEKRMRRSVMIRTCDRGRHNDAENRANR
jgi:hypothetical protein